jgi:hypothetical protein
MGADHREPGIGPLRSLRPSRITQRLQSRHGLITALARRTSLKRVPVVLFGYQERSPRGYRKANAKNEKPQPKLHLQVVSLAIAFSSAVRKQIRQASCPNRRHERVNSQKEH